MERHFDDTYGIENSYTSVANEKITCGNTILYDIKRRTIIDENLIDIVTIFYFFFSAEQVLIEDVTREIKRLIRIRINNLFVTKSVKQD